MNKREARMKEEGRRGARKKPERENISRRGVRKEGEHITGFGIGT